MTFEEIDRLIDKTEAIMMYKQTRAGVISLREKLKNMKEELHKYKNLKTAYAGKEISLEEFERKIAEKTLKVCGDEIKHKVKQILRTESSWPQWFKQSIECKIQVGIKKGLDEQFSIRVQTAIDNAKKAEWPKFLDQYTRKKITPVCQQFIRNQLTDPIEIG